MAEVNADAIFGKDALHITAALSPRSTVVKPVVSARIESKHFNVDRLLAAGAQAVALPTADFLQGWTIDSTLHAEDVRLSGMHLSFIDMPMKIADDRLTLPGHVIDLYGGKLAGSITYDPARQDLTIFETLRDVQLDTLARDGKLNLPFAGKTNATLDVQSQGADLQAMPDKAKGVLRVYAKEGHWLGVDLPRSLLALREGKPGASGPQATTALAELSAAFAVNGPTLEADKLNARGDGFTLGGTGSIQYASRQMDLVLTTRVGNDKTLAALRGKRVSLRAKGPLMQPRISAEP